jgi:glycosyltransferase involved in cell wall biosynthesis
MQTGDELIVVDNGSDDRTPEITRWFCPTKLLIDGNKTIGGLRTLGAASATGQLLAFIDADCVLADDWRIALERTMRECRPDITGSLCVVPETDNWIGKTWYSGRPADRRRVHHINSGNLVIRRERFERVGGFNEALVTDEDSDLEVRLMAAGSTMLEDPAIEAKHLSNPRTLRQFFRRTSWHAVNGLRFRVGGKIDLTMIATAIYSLGLLSLPLCLLFGSGFLMCSAWIVVALFGIPALSSTYRLRRTGGRNYFLQLTLLYSVYFIARIYTGSILLLSRLDSNCRARYWKSPQSSGE